MEPMLISCNKVFEEFLCMSKGLCIFTQQGYFAQQNMACEMNFYFAQPNILKMDEDLKMNRKNC